MACIDIFAPGRLLTVIFLWEQVRIDCTGKTFSTTEVYDFLLQVDDEKELTEFFIGSPHFCRRKISNGKWVDGVQLQPIGDHRTGWGWFYHGDEIRETSEEKTLLTLQVPSPVHPTGNKAYKLSGEVDHSATITWDDALTDENPSMPFLDHMRQLGKSRYRVRIGGGTGQKHKAILPHGGNRMWFRVLVRPAEFDLPEPILEHSTAPWELLVPQRRYVLGNISCPSTVRSNLREKLNTATHLKGHMAVASELGRILLTTGIDAPGGSTRVVDHRLALISKADVKITVQGGQSVPTLNYYGSHRLTLQLPEPRDDLTDGSRSDVPSPPRIPVTVQYWAGGSHVVLAHDLYAVSTNICKEAALANGNKTIAELAHESTATPYAETCYLIKMMGKAGLVVIGDGDRVSVPRFSNVTELYEAQCRLRRIYLDRDYFLDFPEAQLAFTDVHVFRVDFTCDWTPFPRRRQAFLVLVGIFGIATFIMAVIGVLK